MGDPMHGIEEDVPFDFEAASSLISAARNAATSVDTHRISHASWVNNTMTDFKGHFSQLFKSNGETADRDAIELASALRSVVTGVGKLVDDARAEQGRRNDAREWKRHHDNRSGWEQFGDWLSGGDDCPIPEATEQLRWAAPTPSQAPRTTPGPGSYSGGGAGTGTSSARPSDLHTFATNMNGAQDTLSTRKGTFTTALTTFVQGCQWGSLDASGVSTGFTSWVTANQNDSRWAKTVGDAFAAAGGEGNVSSLPNSSIDQSLRAAGVNEVRSDITIAMPSAIGSPPTTGYANDPVNTATGNFVEIESDLEFSVAAGDLCWRRSYNSVHDHDGPFGRGWSSWCETGLSFADDAAYFTLPDGRQLTFPRLGEGWDRAEGESLWLSRVDEHLVVTDNAGSRWAHTTGGRLVFVDRGEGTRVALRWDGDRLVGLSHERGRSISLEWSRDGVADGARIVAVHASDGRSIAYGYDADGFLVSATGPLGTRRYAWNDDDVRRIASVSDADGVVEVENVYDEHGRVVSQRSPHGRVTRFAYLPDRITVVSDEDGTRANTWIADAKGRQVGVIDAHDERQSTAYDRHGNVVMVTERDGRVTIRDFDDRGRMTREVVPDGADIAYAYDEVDRLVRVEVTGGATDVADSAPVAVSTLAYAGEDRDPSTITDPEGGVTRLEWSGGLLSRMVDPEGVSLQLEYDEHGELVATTDGTGATARLERDGAGNIVATVSPTGARVSFEYDDASGLAVRRTDPDGSVWTLEHTAAGRLHAVVDPLGGRTEVEHDEAGESAVTVDPLGRAVRRGFDDLGRLRSVTLPDGSRWTFEHDALGRLTDVADPAGATTHAEYDVVGRVVAVEDPTGARRELTRPAPGASNPWAEGDVPGVRFDVDTLGRLVSQTGRDGSTQLVRYDLCGRPVETVDPLGGVTRLVRDRSGRLTTVVRPSGAEVSYAYDAAGRLEAVTDETGARYRRTYDLDGRVVREVGPTGEATEIRYDTCGRVVARRVPGVGTTTYAYDAAGRLVESRDPRSGRRRFRWDAAGQLVAAVDGNGAETTYSFDEVGRRTQITSAVGGLTRREYDRVGNLVAETDPLGRRTTAEYDAAGRQTAQSDPSGARMEWRYDERGELESTWVDGVERSRIERDGARREIRVTDRSGPGGTTSTHVLTYDAAGRLVSRTRDDRGPAWEYDADGNRVAMTMPGGARVEYVNDAAGRVLRVAHPLLGAVSVERDAAGRVVTASAGDQVQRWTWTDGFPSGCESDGRRTTVERDDQGRIVSVSTADAATTYSFDEACQLVAASTRTDEGEEVVRWRYDAAGRLVSETVTGAQGQASRELVHDLAGQLLSTRVRGEEVASYTYDANGRRVREQRADGSSTDYSWRADGWLAAVGMTDPSGVRSQVDVVVDTSGELARVSAADGLSGEAYADSASRWAPLLALAGEQVLGAPGFTGHLGTGAAGGWQAHGWRDARTTGADPWSLLTQAPALGAAIAATGELLLGGAEWMGARLYEPSTRSFLSPDPLAPTAGAGWAGNPYAFAGNDPLHALDPLGLHPVTDAELEEYNASNGLSGWATNGWGAWVIGGLLVVGGGIAMATGFGGPLGLAMVSAGADTLIQKATTGTVNYGQVLVSGTVGALTGGAGSLVTLGAREAGWSVARTTATQMVTQGTLGAAGGGAHYMAGGGEFGDRGFWGSVAGGGIAGSLGAAGDGAGSAVATHLLGDTAEGAGATAIRQGTAAAVDFTAGSTGSVADQYVSTGHVDAQQAALAGGSTTVANRVGAGLENRFPAEFHDPSAGGDVFDIHHGATGSGAVVQMVTDEAAKHVP
ncbi:hypothetical protein GCM10011519_25870 [Marmoricola endophyticus]|uniref:Type IV secretion protein Rhs n=1 Tax=Marmoricola endophyticus TaxID=2040280 RepID=A0A917BLQ9_9ACTN|nr:DUF6531 domain-containing protein [Marmoricola endophyticus]GGF50736.1 hypothetical protein GCM10011519_25870 [Marmoricola endophyticus]